MSYDRGRGRGRGDGGFSGGRGGGPAGRGYDGGGGFRGDRGGRGGGPGGGRGGFQGGRGEPARLYGGGNVSPPNAEVTKLEDAMVKGEMSSMMTALTIDGGKFQLPKRPGYGTKGRPIMLHTNYLELKGINPETTLYRYSMAFQPDDDSLSKPKKKRIVQLLLSTPPYQGLPIASDWAQLLVSPTKVPIEGTRSATKIEWYPSDGTPLPAPAPEEPERIQKARKKNTFTVLVEDIGTVSVGQLLNDLAQPGTTYPLKLETIQALNVLMAHGPSSAVNIAVAGGNKFYPFGNHPQFEQANLGGGLNALRGYFSSVRTSVNRILVNINVATGAFYKSGPLIDVMTDWTGGSPPQNQFQQAQLAKFVRKLRFETNYLPDKDKDGKVKKDGKGKPLTKRKVHTLIDLSAHGQNSENVKFQIEEADGKTKDVTVAAYFKSKYNITLSKPRAPVVNYGSLIDPKWIPSELCTVLPGQLAKRMLSGSQTSEMIRFAARRPHENAESIMGNGLKVTKIMPVADGLNTSLSRFGIKVNPSLISVQGRILPAPALQYRGKAAPPPLNGAWNLDTRQLGQAPFLVTRPLGAWTALVINSGNRDTLPGGKEGAVALLTSFKRTLDTYGLKAGPVTGTLFVNVEPGLLASRKVGAIQQQIESTLRKAPKPNFLFIVLPSDNAVLYDSIKFLLDVKFGIPNICSIGSKLSKEKGQIQYFANVALKFNQKLGGVNHTVALKELAPLDAQTIVFGIDVTHPSPGSTDDAPSIAGVVASVDDKFSQYPASLRTQKGRQEMVEDLQEMVEERLKLWQKKNQQRLPNKVVVYRDGVSEGQYTIVLREEEPAFQRAFDKLYGAKPKHPKISLMMVGKRHSTRFYPTKQEDTDGRTGNPKPGTIVDRGVTGEKLFDFYLQAHQGLQGTCKPAHYVVLKDENKLGADQLQSLTHNLCYTFARATRSVSVCPPAYYADLLCERGRCYLQGVLKGDGSVKFDKVSSWQRDVNKNLAETMFYL